MMLAARSEHRNITASAISCGCEFLQRGAVQNGIEFPFSRGDLGFQAIGQRKTRRDRIDPHPFRAELIGERISVSARTACLPGV